MLASAQTTDAIECAHCGDTGATAGLFCYCGPTVTCDSCDGDGCRFCHRAGWWQSPSAPEAVDDVDELDGWSWDNARHELAEAMEER
jgi:hypothetical protein